MKTFSLLLLLILGLNTLVFCQITITSISPEIGVTGNSIQINGTGFNIVSDKNVVFFGAVQAVVSQSTASTISTVVPLGATYAPISVLNLETGLTAYSSKIFLPTFAGIKDRITVTDFDILTYAGGSGTKGIALGDMNGDGKADIVSTSSISGTVIIRLNTSTASNINFDPIVSFQTGTGPVFVEVGDLNGDGKLDMVVANSNSNTISIFKNTSTAVTLSFTKSTVATGSFPQYVAIADLDNDGKPDLTVINANNSSFSVFKNTGSSGEMTFEKKLELTTGSTQQLNVADLDQDGLLDLITDDYFNQRINVYRNTSSDGVISFATKQNFTTASSQSIVVGDFDGDGKQDLATGNFYNSSISILRNISSSVGNISFKPQITFPTNGSPKDITTVDINGDGSLDLITSDWGGSRISILSNKSSLGDIYFEPKIDIGTGRTPLIVNTGDFNNDGKLDIITANNSDGTFSVLQNHQQLAPDVQAKDMVITNVSYTEATLNWTNGNGSSRAVFIKGNAQGSITIPPLKNSTSYAANSLLSSNTELGQTGWYCIYNGTGSNVSITGLRSGTFYQTMVCEYEGITGEELYATYSADNNPSSFKTPSNVATLSSIQLSNGTISPSISPTVFSYTALSGSGNSITITPTATYANATIKINGVLVQSGQTSSAIPINTGRTSISIVVTSEDLTTVNSYTLIIGKGTSGSSLSNLTLSAGSITPSFTSGGHTYSVSVPFSTASISLTPFVGSSNATVYINEIQNTSGTASQQLDLNEGNNKIIVSVIAQNGISKTDYEVTVYRTPASLPLNLLSFRAERKGEATLLTWKTSMESNTLAFEIEYSLDGKSFYKLASQKAAKESSEIRNYSYIHHNPNGETNYYRLKMIDLSGLFSYSNIVGFNLNLEPSTFKIYPNPAKESISVSYKAKGTILKFQIIDMKGNFIKMITPINNSLTEISLNDLKSGTYILRLSDETSVRKQLFVIDK